MERVVVHNIVILRLILVSAHDCFFCYIVPRSSRYCLNTNLRAWKYQVCKTIIDAPETGYGASIPLRNPSSVGDVKYSPLMTKSRGVESVTISISNLFGSSSFTRHAFIDVIKISG